MKTSSVVAVCGLLVVFAHRAVCQQIQGENFTTNGSAYTDVSIYLRGRTWVTFQVEASEDATVGLAERPFQTANLTLLKLSYVIVFGAENNTYACIRKGNHGSEVQRTNIRGLVSASELRWFWISWQTSKISYGRGNQRGENVIGYYNDPEPSSVNFMLISSYGNNTGFWVIPAVYYVTDCRLVNGDLLTEGRLETGYGTWWNSYSAEGFDDHEAGVACLMLGFGRSGMTLSHRYEPLTQGWASHCEGHEDDLSKCTRDFDENAVKAVFISCSNSVLQPTAVTKDGNLLVHPNGNDSIYGNSVVLRNNTPVDVNYAFTSWINTITTLSPGILTNFYLFIERRNDYPSLKRLQIWRPVSDAQFKLVWQRIANFDGDDGLGLYKFDVSADNFEVSAGDCIGWVNEDNNTWISADQCTTTDPCQCSRLYDFTTTYNWPVGNETLTFECRPYNFSVAAEIQPFTTYSFVDTTLSVTDQITSNISSSNEQEGVLLIIIIVVVCVVVLIIAAVLLTLLICYKTKRCCFSKSSPAFEPAMTKNADDLGPAANSSTASSDLAPSAPDDAGAEQSERL